MFIPRHSVVADQFCSYAENADFGDSGAGNVVAYAGSVVYLDPTADNEESMVKKMDMDDTSLRSEIPFGFIMQKVKVGYHAVHPTGFYMPGDLGSSDVIANPLYNPSGNIAGHKSAPVGVAHLGIYDTAHYQCVLDGDGVVTSKMTPGQTLYAAANEARVTNSAVDGNGTDTLGERCSDTAVARVMKGASVAKCQANTDNVALTPIRIKLLV